MKQEYNEQRHYELIADGFSLLEIHMYFSKGLNALMVNQRRLSKFDMPIPETFYGGKIFITR